MLRAALRRIRHRTNRAARFASRLNRVTRYGLDLVLWSHLLSRKSDPVPVELARELLDSKAVNHPAPRLHVSGPSEQAACWDEGFAGVYATLLLNLQMPDEISAVRYAHPGPSFRGVYLWDSAFISQVWKHWDVRVARDVTQAVIDLRDGDRMQHVVADLTESAFTQPPVLAWAVSQLACAPECRMNTEWLAHAYAALAGYHRWLDANRRLPSGLYAWAHPYESGIDNSPRFSSQDERVLADTTRLAAPDFSAYVVLQCEALAELADALGRHEADGYRRKADQLRARMNELLWHEADGLYYDCHADTGEMVRSKTIASLLPLWAGVPSHGQAERLVAHAANPDSFGTLIPLPSVARDDPEFVKDMWRGPVWINTSFAVIKGIERYGFWEDAGELAYRLCEGVYETFSGRRRFYEFYDPERFDIEELRRKEGHRWKHWTLGRKPCGEFVGWTGLVNTLVIETLIGLRHEAGRRVLRPLLPESTSGQSFSVRLPQEHLSITVEREGGRVLGVVRDGAATRRFEAPLGQPLELDSTGGNQPAAVGVGAPRGPETGEPS